MIIPDDYAIPGLAGIATILTGTFAWLINLNRQNVDSIEKRVSELEILHHETKIKRELDVDVINNLTRNMEALSSKITDLRIELQNKQSRL